jgi:hypothetical protein
LISLDVQLLEEQVGYEEFARCAQQQQQHDQQLIHATCSVQ